MQQFPDFLYLRFFSFCLNWCSTCSSHSPTNSIFNAAHTELGASRFSLYIETSNRSYSPPSNPSETRICFLPSYMPHLYLLFARFSDGTPSFAESRSPHRVRSLRKASQREYNLTGNAVYSPYVLSIIFQLCKIPDLSPTNLLKYISHLYFYTNIQYPYN